MHNIWTITKKELKRFFTDPRMVIGLILPGLLIFIIYTIMGNVMTNALNPENASYTIYIENEPVELKEFLTSTNWQITINPEKLSKEEILDKLLSKEVDLYIIYEENFYQKVLSYDMNNDSSIQSPSVELYYNSTSTTSNTIYNYYASCLNQFESSISNKFDINPDTSVKYDVASSEDTTIQAFSMFLPFLLIVFLFSGAMSVCSESIAGEKERGTIATLLITPTKRSSIAIGKIIALGITSLASAFASFLGLTFSLPKLIGDSFSIDVYGISTFILMFIIIIVTVLLFTTLLTIISTYARSVKEANSYAIPLMMIVLLIGVTNFMSSDISHNYIIYLIPIYNLVQCLIGVFSINIDPISFIICIISNIAYIGIGVFLLTKMFNNERIIFNK